MSLVKNVHFTLEFTRLFNSAGYIKETWFHLSQILSTCPVYDIVTD